MDDALGVAVGKRGSHVGEYGHDILLGESVPTDSSNVSPSD